MVAAVTTDSIDDGQHEAAPQAKCMPVHPRPKGLKRRRPQAAHRPQLAISVEALQRFGRCVMHLPLPGFKQRSTEWADWLRRYQSRDATRRQLRATTWSRHQYATARARVGFGPACVRLLWCSFVAGMRVTTREKKKALDPCELRALLREEQSSPCTRHGRRQITWHCRTLRPTAPATFDSKPNLQPTSLTRQDRNRSRSLQRRVTTATPAL